MLKKSVFLIYVLPLYVISPMVNVGNFGFSVAEILTFFYGLALFYYRKVNVQLPKVIFFFFILIFIGRIGALLNSFDYNLPFNYSKFIFLFIFLIEVLGYIVGRTSGMLIQDIVQHKFTKYAIGLTCFIATTYLLTDVNIRSKLLYLFLQQTSVSRLGSPRFPGLGINANLYSFFVYVFFVFSLKNYFDHRTNFTVPLFCVLIIFFCAGKTTIFLVFLALAVFALNNFFKPGDPLQVKQNKKKSAKMLYVLLGIGICSYIISTNEDLSYYFIFLRRLNELVSNENDYNSFNDRGELWGLGWERIKIAPYFGIDIVQPDQVSDTIPLYFANPHNEFLYYWMSLGIIGFVTYILFLVYLILRNCIPKFRIAWVLLYVSLALQMLVDSAFQSLKFQFFFFILLGLNYNELQKRKKINGAIGGAAGS